MAVVPTRALSRSSPLSDMTLDQFLLIHGQQPTIKPLPPPRQPGRALTQQQVEDFQKSGGAVPQPNPDNVPYTPPGGFANTPLGRSLQQVADETAQEIMARKTHKQKQRTTVRPAQRTGTLTNGQTVQFSSQAQPAPNAALSPPRPKPGQAHVLVPETQPDAAPFDAPCEHVMEIIVEVQGVGTIAYPMTCEVLGVHPNQPHMMRVYGRSQNENDPEQDVFVGWGDVVR